MAIGTTVNFWVGYPMTQRSRKIIGGSTRHLYKDTNKSESFKPLVNLFFGTSYTGGSLSISASDKVSGGQKSFTFA
jgi:hypothetical protein